MMIKLINPSYTKSIDDRLDPPLGLMYMASVLEEAGYPVEIVDLCVMTHNKWREAVGKADVVGITVMTPLLHIAKEILRIAKRNNPEAIVVAGGAHASDRPQETLSEGFDVVIVGEAEYTFLNLVKAIAEGKDFDAIIFSPKVDVNTLPFPARHLIDLKAYTRKVAGEPATTIISSRGCPYHCAFCEKAVHGEGFRDRSIQSIVEEIKQVIRQYGIRAFKFDDDTLTVNKHRLYELLCELKKLGIRFRCHGNARMDTYEDFVRLHEAGCYEIIFGIESGSQTVLDLINKQVTVEQNRKAIIDAKKAGLIVRANLMVGNPGESWGTIEETIAFMWQTQPQHWILTSFIPFYGCPIGKNPAKYGITILVKDLRQYFLVAGKNVGGLTHRTEHMSMKNLANARKHLVESLPPQTGFLDDYHAKLR